jgi:hypothetical protein
MAALVEARPVELEVHDPNKTAAAAAAAATGVADGAKFVPGR